MTTKMKKAKEILQAKGFKPTFQRLRILEYLQRHKNHPTVEMIYEDLVKEIPTISKTTIYNTLNALVEKGIVCGITITGTEIRYGYRSFPHHHFLCKRCGKVIDIEVECPYVKRGQICGHRIEELHGYFKGICKECSRKKDKK
jgi:Fe2+ or Zn2+ uptake regulation protein